MIPGCQVLPVAHPTRYHHRATPRRAEAMVLVDEQTWVKAGIEYCDGVPRLSCVVTNDGFSAPLKHTGGGWDALNGDASNRSTNLDLDQRH